MICHATSVMFQLNSFMSVKIEILKSLSPVFCWFVLSPSYEFVCTFDRISQRIILWSVCEKLSALCNSKSKWVWRLVLELWF